MSALHVLNIHNYYVLGLEYMLNHIAAVSKGSVDFHKVKINAHFVRQC